MSADVDCREDLQIFFVFQQAEFLCDEWNNHISQLTRTISLRKEEGERNMVAVYTQRNERVTHIIPLMKKGKLNILSVQLIVNEDDMCGSCMRLYTVD